MTSYDETSMRKKVQVEVAVSCKDMEDMDYLTCLHVLKHEFYPN